MRDSAAQQSHPVARRLALLAGALLVFGAACHTMRPVAMQQLLSSSVNPIWVTRPDHSVIIIHAPAVRGDTLAGFVDGAFREMPLADAKVIRTREPAPAKTAAVAAAAGAVALGSFLYFGNRSYVGGNAQTCETGIFGDLPVACCRVQVNTPC